MNPDFSQIESDVAQITANERFALFYPEKRPFFLEGINLFSTPIQAVYTRTITSPRFGARGTGKWGALDFTGLVADDRGGGQVVIPGPNGSSFADQDDRSFVGIGRVRRDFGQSFVSVLLSDRERQGGSWNRVLGPDFQWRPNDKDVVAGQLLWSDSQTPNQPDLAEEWDGRHLADHAGLVSWTRSTRTLDLSAEYRDVGDDFRADNGFVPQAGYRRGYLEPGYTWWPKTGLLRRFRTYLIGQYSADRNGDLLEQVVSPGFGFDARWYTFVRIRYAWERLRAGEGTATLPRGPARLHRAEHAVAPAARHHSRRLRRQRHRLRRWTPRHGRTAHADGAAATDRPPRAAARRGGPLARRRHGGARQGPPLHRPGRPPACHLHVHRAQLRARDRAVRLHPPRPHAVRGPGGGEGRQLHGLGPARLQAQLADRAVRRLRGQPRADRHGQARARQSRQLFVKLSYAFQR